MIARISILDGSCVGPRPTQGAVLGSVPHHLGRPAVPSVPSCRCPGHNHRGEREPVGARGSPLEPSPLRPSLSLRAPLLKVADGAFSPLVDRLIEDGLVRLCEPQLATDLFESSSVRGAAPGRFSASL